MHEEHEAHQEPQLPAEDLMHTQAELDVLCNQDLLKLFFEKLGRLALCSAGATCRQWRQVAASDEFWTSLDFSGLGVSPWQVPSGDWGFPSATCHSRRILPGALCSSVHPSNHYNSINSLVAVQMVPLLQRHPNVQVLNLRGIPAGASLLQRDLPELTRQDSLHAPPSCGTTCLFAA